MVEASEDAPLNVHLFDSTLIDKPMDEHLFEGVEAFLTRSLLGIGSLLDLIVCELDLKNGSVSAISDFLPLCEIASCERLIHLAVERLS